MMAGQLGRDNRTWRPSRPRPKAAPPARGRVPPWLLVLSIATGCALAFLSWHLSKTYRPAADGPEDATTAPPAPPPPRPPTPRLDDAFAPSVRLIGLPPVDGLAAVARQFRSPPDAVCQTLGSIGFAATPWQPGQLDDTASECLLGPVRIGAEPEASAAAGDMGGGSSLFVILRGWPAEIWQLRIKAIRQSSADGKALHDAVERVIDALRSYPELALPEAAAAALLRGKAFKDSDGDREIRVDPEPSAPGRVNLTFSYRPGPRLTLPRPAVDPLAEAQLQAWRHAKPATPAPKQP